MDKIKGTGVALITPFNEDFSIDYDSLEELINYQINGGIDFLVVMGPQEKAQHFLVKRRWKL